MSATAVDIDHKVEAFAAFRASEPGYAASAVIDVLRREEFARLDRLGSTYLDYTGSGLYAESQIRRHADLLAAGVFGNPHSISPASSASTEAVEECRERVLTFLAADPEEYVVLFTGNASQALRLVGESYPFQPGDEFLLTFDNHNSVNGIREFARARGARTRYIPAAADLRAADDVVEAALTGRRPGARHALFAYPAQSNFSGVQHPLEWIARARAHGFDVLLDAAAFVPTNRLDLSRWKPDFVSLSFYKMFGYPTGVGALVARRDAVERLRRPWFAGGTVDVVSVQADRFVAAGVPARFEDGTPDFLALPAVTWGLGFLEGIDIDVIHARVAALTRWLLASLTSLHHGNGRPLVTIYGPTTMERRGGTIAFNVLTADGTTLSHQLVDERAAARRISLRTGCFCNPGGGEVAFGLSRPEIERCLDGDPGSTTSEAFRACLYPKPAGAIRASLGLASSFDDVWTLMRFLESFREP